MFYDKFIELCKSRGKSPAAVVKDIGLNNSSPTAWKHGASPNGDTLQKLAEYFEVSVDYLLGVYHLKGVLNYRTATVRDRIFEAIKRAGLSNEEFCLKLGLPVDEWFKWREGESTSYLDYLPEIAGLLGISEEVLSGKKPDITPPDKIRLMAAFDRLNPSGQQEAVKHVEQLTEIPRFQRQEPQNGPDAPKG